MEVVLLKKAQKDRDYWKQTGNVKMSVCGHLCHLSFVIFDFGNAVISHYNIKIYIYIIVYTLTSSFSDFDKMTNDIMTS